MAKMGRIEQEERNEELEGRVREMGVIIDGHVEKIKKIDGECSKVKRENEEYRLELAAKEETIYSLQAKVQKY